MANPNAQLITAADSLLLVIDLQEKFVPFLKGKARIIQSARLLARTAQQLKIPVVVTEHNPKRIGPTIPEIAEVLPPGTPVYPKDIFSCFGDAGIRQAVLARRQVKNILVVGCETHICVMQTTLEALALGLNVHVVSNGVGSRKEIDWERGLARIGAAGAVPATSEMTAYELLRRSDGPDFKALLPYFKEWVNRDED